MSNRLNNNEAPTNETSRNESLKRSALTSTALAAFMSVAPLAVPSAAAQDQGFDPNKRFSIEYQEHPVTNPNSPSTLTKDVDCAKLAPDPLGRGVAITGAFVDQFDLPPYRAASGVRDSILDGAYAFRHIGGLSPENHQFCVPLASVYDGAKPDANGRVTIRTGQSLPLADDRLCPVVAAFKICTTNTDDDKTLSPVYRVDEATGNVHFVPENLQP